MEGSLVGISDGSTVGLLGLIVGALDGLRVGMILGPLGIVVGALGKAVWESLGNALGQKVEVVVGRALGL